MDLPVRGGPTFGDAEAPARIRSPEQGCEREGAALRCLALAVPQADAAGGERSGCTRVSGVGSGMLKRQ